MDAAPTPWLGEPGAGEYILITDYSKDAIGAILHQVQPGATRYIGAKGRKCRAYGKNYHSFRLWFEKIQQIFAPRAVYSKV